MLSIDRLDVPFPSTWLSVGSHEWLNGCNYHRFYWRMRILRLSIFYWEGILELEDIIEKSYGRKQGEFLGEMWPTLYRMQGCAVNHGHPELLEWATGTKHQLRKSLVLHAVVGTPWPTAKQQLEGTHLPQLITRGQIENVKMYLTPKFISEGEGSDGL